MTDTSKVPGGDDDTTGGGDEDSTGTGKTVSRDAYERLLREKKALGTKLKGFEERLTAFESDKTQREEDEAKKRNAHEELLRKKDEEITGFKTKLTALETEKLQNRKLGAFLRAAGGTIDPKYYALIDVDAIEADSEGNIDAESVKKSVDAYKTTYGETIGKGGGGAGVPGTKPNGDGSGAPLTEAEYRALPLAERKKRMGDFAKVIAKR